MTLSDAVTTIASEFEITPGDLEIVLQAVTKGRESQAKWIRLCRIANCNHSGGVTLNLNRGCITSTETRTTLEALDKTLSQGG